MNVSSNGGSQDFVVEGPTIPLDDFTIDRDVNSENFEEIKQECIANNVDPDAAILQELFNHAIAIPQGYMVHYEKNNAQYEIEMLWHNRRVALCASYVESESVNELRNILPNGWRVFHMGSNQFNLNELKKCLQ